MSSQLHNCKKKNCFYCYEMNRVNNPFAEKYKKAWSEREIRFLLDNYRLMSGQEIANVINRSVTSVWYKASMLNVKRYAAVADINQLKNTG